MNGLINQFENPIIIYKRYSDELLDKLNYSDVSALKSYQKLQLTPKQKKARSKTKQQRQSRKNNRKN